jgi:DNA-binding NarL/FixJ family response regulator
MAVRVVIADDHGVLRAGLRALLGAEPGFEVVGEAGSGEEAIRILGECRPDVMLLDVSLPGISGLEATKLLKAKRPRTHVLILTVHEDETMLREAIRAGASGYISKRAVESELIGAIHAVLRGEIYVDPAMTRGLLQDRKDRATPRRSDPASLTRRESAVLRLLVQGCTNRQVAEELGLSVRTAETHRANIMGKLGLKSRVELVRWAVRQRLIV